MSGLAALMTLTAATAGWSQQQAAPAIPQFPPGPDFAGVAGSAAEHARITALCGPNRNAADGYSPAPAFPGQTRAPIVAGRQGYAVESVAKIDRPWGMAFLPNGRMLVSFRNGGLRIVSLDGTVSEPLAGAPQIVNPRLGSGMYDVILDRDFARNRTLYLTYHTQSPGDQAAMGRVVSARLSRDEKSLEGLKVLREGADIQPRRVVQARDGTLLVLSAGVADNNAIHQDLKSQLGKVLRINTDGSIPKDNPFTAVADANPAVWALGYRDVHSAVIHPATGELWVADNTPRGGDELNIFRKGRNYGFPVISYGRMNSGALLNGGKTAQEGMEQPLYWWTPSIAPSGMTFYTGNALPQWKGDLFIGAMSGMQLVRLRMDGEKVVEEEKLLLDRCQRIKTVVQGPDGYIYVLTDEAPPKQNEILRLVPARTMPTRRTAPTDPVPTRAVPRTAEDRTMALGQDAYASACAACHGVRGEGRVGPAVAGRTDASEIVAAIEHGVGSMPAIRSLNAQEREAVARYVATLKPAP
jgi:glucose/arabinose dehydrogenase/cytochrome c553